MELTPGTRLGPYEILGPLGAGGMGQVWHARDVNLDRGVAIKVLHDAAAENRDWLARFDREARLLAALTHPNIAIVYGLDEIDGFRYIVMELVPGQTLSQRLSRGALPLDEALQVGRQLAEALEAAHDRGIIHRDLKPANVMLTPEGKVKVLDFGLAHSKPPTDEHADFAGQSEGQTWEGAILGTPAYMAPEQARGRTVDRRCDIWALGCVLFEALTGRPAFSGPTFHDTLAAVSEKSPDWKSLPPGVPPRAADLLRRCLQKDLQRRLRDAGDVRLELEDALAELRKGPSASSAISVRRTEPISPHGPRSAGETRRWSVIAGILLIGAVASFAVWNSLGIKPPAGRSVVFVGTPLKVGVLQSLTGTMRDSGASVIEATRLAIEEINQQGGILGREIEPVVRDGQSKEATYKREVEELIGREKVCTIFGCWTSSSRKTIKPIVEAHENLLIYPVQYEGLEVSPNIVYTGAAPNQQIIPAVRYCFTELSKRRFFLVGSDYVFPRTANEIIKDELTKLGANVVGERYLLLGSPDVKPIVDEILLNKPDIILNTINGDSNGSFFHALRRAGIKPAAVPTVSFSVGEQELLSLNIDDMIGDYAAWNYFQSINRPENQAFIRRFRARYGPDRVISDPMEAAYFSVYLWKQAVEKAGSDDPRAIREAIKGQSFDAPQGLVTIDPDNQHTWKVFRMGQIVKGGTFKIVDDKGSPQHPEPFPRSRSRAAWEQFLTDLQQKWKGQWYNPEG